MSLARHPISLFLRIIKMHYSLIALFVTLVALSVECGGNFNGTWKLDRDNSDSSYDLLVAIGMSSFRSGMASRLDISDTYRISHLGVSIHRVTRYTDITTLYLFGQDGNTEDHILGTGSHLTLFKNDQIIYNFVRRSDGALYHSIKSITVSDQMHVYMNFTLGSRHVSCRQRYVRQ